MLKCQCSKAEYKTYQEYRNYRKQVLRVTNRQPLYLLEDFHKRGRSGKKNSYHLDHILSVSYGFHHGIDPEIIGGIRNLRMIPWKQNLEKSEFMEQESWDLFQYFIENGEKV